MIRYMSLKSTLTVVVGLSIVFTNSSCEKILGKDDDDAAAAPSVQDPVETAVDDVQILAREDTECATQKNYISSMNEASIWKWDGGQAVQTKVAISGSIGADGELISDGVLGAIQDYQVVYECVFKDGDVDRADEGTKKSSGELVSFCRTDSTYGRNSIESVTLTSQYFVSMAYTAYKSLTSAKSAIVDSILLIQPRFIQNVKLPDSTYKRVMLTDNAAFSTMESDDGTYGLFAVFPSSLKFFADAPVHFWEVPFIMSHEFGHNVFNHHVGEAAVKAHLKIKSSYESYFVLQPKISRGFLMLTEQMSAAEKALGGINELYADLFSYFLNDAQDNLLQGVPCMEKTRDLKSEVTAQGVSKIWSEAANDVFTEQADPAASEDCSEPTYDSVHDIAAILGYASKEYVEASMVGATKAQKLDALLTFADQISTHVAASGSSVSLDSIYKIFVSVIKSKRTTGAGSLATVCAALSTRIPTLTASSAACL